MKRKLFFFGYDLANLDFITLLKNICIDEELGTTPQFNALSFLVFFIRLISSIFKKKEKDKFTMPSLIHFINK